MDENKELFTGETEAIVDAGNSNTEAAEETAEQMTEETAEAATEEAAEATEEATEETVEEAAEDSAEAAAPAPKKKRTLQFTILISIIIVLCVLAAAVVCRLFFMQGVVNTNLVGAKTTTTWHYRPDTSQLAATVDEAMVPDYYFIFEPDGAIKVALGTLEFEGSYTLHNLEAEELSENSSVKAGTPVLSITGTQQIDGTFTYERSGNAVTGSTLKLTSIMSGDATVTLDSKDYVPVSLTREDEFTPDSALTGSWTYQNEMGKQTFRFNDDGSYEMTVITNGGVQKEKGIYNCGNGTLTRTYQYIGTPQQDVMKYTVKDDKLTFVVQGMDYYGQPYEQTIDFTKNQ